VGDPPVRPHRARNYSPLPIRAGPQQVLGYLPPAQLAIVGLGVELTAFAPSLSAFVVGWLLPGAGGARTLFRQVKRWRVRPIWYLIGLLGPCRFC